MANYLIIGGSGFIGKYLCRSLIDDGHVVTVKTRNSTKAEDTFKELGCNPNLIEGYEQLTSNILPDVVISLAGAGVIDKRWNDSRKKELINSRVQPIVELNNWLNASQHKPKKILIGSAIGFYGYSSEPETTLFENSAFTQDFAHQICQDTEQQGKLLSELSDHVIALRTGVVLSPHDGALKKMLTPAKFHLNGKIGNGQQWMSWIHISDWIRATKHIIELEQPKKAYNLTTPNPVRNVDMSKAIAESINKPFQIGIPTISLKLLLGKSSILLAGGQKVLPKNLLNDKFEFKHETIEKALRH